MKKSFSNPFFLSMKETKTKIRKFFDKWHDLLLLHEWKIELQYHFDRCENSPRTSASAPTQWEYKRATINFYLPFLCVMSDEDLEEVVVHEIMHIILSEMREYDSSREESIHHEERVATTLSRSILNIRKKK